RHCRPCAANWPVVDGSESRQIILFHGLGPVENRCHLGRRAGGRFQRRRQGGPGRPPSPERRMVGRSVQRYQLHRPALDHLGTIAVLMGELTRETNNQTWWVNKTKRFLLNEASGRLLAGSGVPCWCSLAAMVVSRLTLCWSGRVPFSPPIA